MMFKITIYDSGNIKTIDEMEDEDEMRETVGRCLNDIEEGEIKSFTVSCISNNKHYQKPFWED